MMATGPPVPRGYGMAAFDRWWTWFLGLPTGKYSYGVQPIQVPMPDGVLLAADLYQPDTPAGSKKRPLLLVQGCYGRGLALSILNARIYAVQGYTVLYVSTRGTFGSGGEFEPGRSERADSQSIVEWMRRQDWYPGSFATTGASYSGQAQWSLLDDPPEDCVASVILAGPHDYARHWWGTGSLRLDRLAWGDLVSHQEDGTGFLVRERLIPRMMGKSPIVELMKALPLMPAVEKHFGDGSPWMQKSLNTPDVEDEWWAPTRHQAALENINMPVMLIGGWQDPFLYQTIEQYERLSERGCKVALTVGPWNHTQASGLKSMPGAMNFLDEHLAGDTQTPRGLEAHIYVTGAEEWRQMPQWPPKTAPHELFLHADGSLGKEMPSASDSPSTSFVYDPQDPTPTLGGTLLMDGGVVDDSAFATRDDVLVFDSEILDSDLEVLGKPVVQLEHSTDVPYADLWVRLSEVNEKGVSHNVSDGFQALDPKRDTATATTRKPIELALETCARRFKKGSRVRVIIGGGTFTWYARNLGTGESRLFGSETQRVRHSIAYSGGLSKLKLPVALT